MLIYIKIYQFIHSISEYSKGEYPLLKINLGEVIMKFNKKIVITIFM